MQRYTILLLIFVCIFSVTPIVKAQTGYTQNKTQTKPPEPQPPVVVEPEEEEESEVVVIVEVEPEPEEEDEVIVQPPVEEEEDEVIVQPPVEEEEDEVIVQPPVEEEEDEVIVQPPVEEEEDEVIVQPPVEEEEEEEVVQPPQPTVVPGTYQGPFNVNDPSTIPRLPKDLLVGFIVDIHFLAVDPKFQYIAYHYCSDLFVGYSQCLIYNGTADNSRMIGMEIILREDVYQNLPLAERKQYHSHQFAVKSGLMVTPGVPADKEPDVLNWLIHTYGKIIDVWHSYQTFPFAGPKLAFGITEESQINDTIAQQLDKELNLGTTYIERKQQRANLIYPDKVKGADDWLESGVYNQWVTTKSSVINN